MKTSRERAVSLLDKLTDSGVSYQAILEHIIFDYMDGSEAYQALLSAEEEFFSNEGDDDEDDFAGEDFDDED